ncbi:hypothetical protein NDU88_006727 [Pleurodeles waltl]|uniref:Uncharacterized protein n=1 Tax=Pleurodeles waltl TaxID=8319 RepID=A0AAV7WFM4_PLEWA|nr:hypothetical protein NDU88_006727 [Pleurodeles waltl]
MQALGRCAAFSWKPRDASQWLKQPDRQSVTRLLGSPLRFAIVRLYGPCHLFARACSVPLKQPCKHRAGHAPPVVGAELRKSLCSETSARLSALS